MTLPASELLLHQLVANSLDDNPSISGIVRKDSEIGEMPLDSNASVKTVPSPNLLKQSLDMEDKPESTENPSKSFGYNNHNEAIYDEASVFPGLKQDSSIAKFDAANPELINHATIIALIVQLTSPEVVDYNLVYDFFITYRMFSNAETIMELLTVRLVWSLQYINKEDPESQKIGQLVLLRTFVVLRHWILNYFIDDFNSDLKLCDMFISSLNEIVFDSQLIDDLMVFERKIIKDLKIHWLTLLTEFWNISLDLSSLSQEEVFGYFLPPTSELSSNNFLKKSNTEMSIHTNPSYRRSAMLSLYDQKTHHMCLVFDDSKFDNNENPQLSVNNLLVLHKSSRQSIMNKLNHFNLVKGKSNTPKDNNSAGSGYSNNINGKTNPLALTNKHNRMNLNDSSIGLKKTSTVKARTQPKELDKISLNPVQIENVGFSTNGNVKLPSSKVTTIVPSTPVKKMEYQLCSPTNDAELHVNEWSSPINSKIIDNMDVGRKNSIKKILEGWKKNKNHSNKSTENINQMINDSISEDIIGTRVDILSARIIDELEFLIRNYIQNDSSYNPTIVEGDSIDNTNLPTANDDVDLENFDESIDMEQEANEAKLQPQTNDGLDGEECDINDTSGLNLNKIDNLFSDRDADAEEDEDEEFKDTNEDFEENKAISPTFINDIHEFSFQRPTSINWNDETDLELDNSQNDISNITPQEPEQGSTNSDGELPEPDLPGDNDKLTRLAEPPSAFTQHKNFSTESTISTPSDMTDYNAEIEDLGIAMSPKSKEQQTKRISFNQRGSGITRRVSRNSSIFKRESVKSYISYDSEFSVSKGSLADDGENGNLRKKAGVNDLRRLAGLPSERRSLEYPVRIQSSSSIRRSIRTSTVVALSELPFNGQYDSRSSVNLFSQKMGSRSSAVGDSSIFSVAIKSRTSIAASFQTLNESSRISKSNPSDLDSEEFAFGFRASNDEGFGGEKDNSTRSVAIPGISNNVLKELAAIPDESFHFNPIDFALNKLEGNKGKGEFDDELNQSETTQVDLEDTQDILNEINNADTQDIIDTSSQKDFTSEMPLTPVGNEAINSSTPSGKELVSSGGTLDSTQLENGGKNDNVFIFSANYSSDSKTSATQYKPSSFQSPRLILQSYNLYDNALSIENIMTEGSHISFILSYSSQELSEHFTIIERDILQEIDWKELVELKWNKELTPVNSWLEIIVNEDYYNSNKGVNLVISRFNLMVNWIISEVLLTKHQDERVQILSRFIHIAQGCLQLQNYSTLMQILLALTSERLAKLRDTWKSLPPGDILILKNLEELASPLKNFLNLRISINKVQPSRGCIPFVGLYLSDLIFNTERPKFIDNAKEVVNFARFRTSVHIVKSLSQCIEWSSYYKLSVNNELLSKCLYIRSLNEDEMNYCLTSTCDP